MDSAPDFESGGWGFESLRDRFVGMGVLVCIYMIGQLVSAIGLVVKYLVANEVPRVRFPDGAFAFVAQLAARGSHNPKVAGSTPVESIFGAIRVTKMSKNGASGGIRTHARRTDSNLSRAP